jgi:asparagine synthase (glutamine-hydrolysing)
MYRLFATVKQHSTVSLSAEAADEIFGGYPWFHDETLIWRDQFPWRVHLPRLADCLAPDIRTRVRPAEMEADRYATQRAQVPALPGESRREARMREVLYFSLQRPLAHLLDRKDRMSMAVGLEVRVPFCDHRLVEYLWNVPWAMKTADGHGKSALRMAAQDLVPRAIMDRPKSGFPVTHDPAYQTSVLSAVSKILEDPSSPLYGLLDTERIRALMGGSGHAMSRIDVAHHLSRLVEADTWMRTHDLKPS